MPLKFTLSPKGGGKAVFDVGFTKVSFSAAGREHLHLHPAQGREGHRGRLSGDLRPSLGPARRLNHGSRERHAQGRRRQRLPADRARQGLGLHRGHHRPGGAAAAHGKAEGGKAKGGGDASSLINSFGTRVTGAFGSGTMFHTRLVNVLLTDKGTMYVGAVTQSALTDAANGAK